MAWVGLLLMGIAIGAWVNARRALVEAFEHHGGTSAGADEPFATDIVALCDDDVGNEVKAILGAGVVTTSALVVEAAVVDLPELHPFGFASEFGLS